MLSEPLTCFLSTTERAKLDRIFDVKIIEFNCFIISSHNKPWNLNKIAAKSKLNDG